MRTLLELYILCIVNETPEYGYNIRDIITTIFGVQPSKAACYTRLYSLELGGFLSSEERKGLPKLPHRRYYSITEAGKTLLRGMVKYLESVVPKQIDEDTGTKPKKHFIHPTA